MAITLRGDANTTFDNNIGIGTTTPDEALHVHATGTTQIAAEFEADNAETYIQFTGTDATQVLYGRDSADACIQVNSNDVFKAKSGGNCEIVDGNLVLAQNHGIHFHNYDDGTNIDSNLLDDYEEGTFTPTLGDAWTGINYDLQVARYTKVGNLVHVVITIKFDSTGHSTSTRPQVSGLPFTSSSQTSNYGGTLSWGFGTLEVSSNTSTTWYVPPGFAHATMYATAGSNFNSFPNANANNDWIQIAGCYTAA